jgi:hypothetical protein
LSARFSSQQLGATAECILSERISDVAKVPQYVVKNVMALCGRTAAKVERDGCLPPEIIYRCVYLPPITVESGRSSQNEWLRTFAMPKRLWSFRRNYGRCFRHNFGEDDTNERGDADTKLRAAKKATLVLAI